MERVKRIAIFLLFIFLILTQVYGVNEDQDDGNAVEGDLWIEDYDPDPGYHPSQNDCKDNSQCTESIKYCMSQQVEKNSDLSRECRMKLYMPCEAEEEDCLVERDGLFAQYERDEEIFQRMLKNCIGLVAKKKAEPVRSGKYRATSSYTKRQRSSPYSKKDLNDEDEENKGMRRYQACLKLMET